LWQLKREIRNVLSPCPMIEDEGGKNVWNLKDQSDIIGMMSEINLDQLIEILPKLIRENDRVKGAIISALAGVVATKEDIAQLIAEMDRRFEAMQGQMNNRFEAMDRRFEALQEQIKDRFEAMDQHFNAVQAENNQRFNRIEQTMATGFSQVTAILNSIQTQIGKPFEQFGRNVVIRILQGEGFERVKLSPKIFRDPNHIVFHQSEEVEVDGFSEDPPVIVEITSILRDQEKVEKFLKKKAFIEDLYQREFRGFFVAAGTEVDENIKLDLVYRLRQHQCELINL